MKQKKEIDIQDIYTTLPKARKELVCRWSDKGLRKKVEDYLGCELPEPFKNGSRAVLSRSIITPNFECLHFLETIKKTELAPLGLEGVEDKFCTKNIDKVALGKLILLDSDTGINTKSEKKIVKIIDMADADGKRFCDIKTLWGEDFVDFHHQFLKSNNCKIEVFDDFKWFSSKNKKNSTSEYYQNLFAFFICHGVLFENFHTKGKEVEFTKNIILKNFKHVMDYFEIKPLIVPLVPVKHEMRLDHWNAYKNNKF